MIPRRCKTATTFALVAMAGLVLLSAAAQVSLAADRLPYVEGRLIVTLKPGTSTSHLESLNRTYKGRIIRRLPVPDTYLVEVPSKSGVSANAASASRPLDWYVTRYSASTKVRAATPDYYAKTCAVPNDTRWNEQWDMVQIGMPAAWDIEKGNSAITVAVVDNGVSPTHPDLASRLVPGWDTADNDNDTSPVPGGDAPGHGTHVAGTIGAVTNNALGVAGVCWEGVEIMPIKVFPNSTPDGAPFSAIIDGLDYAMTHGADVVNMSIGGSVGTEALWQKIKQLDEAGILMAVSAGNEYHGRVSYPAAYPECIAVSAVDRNGQLTFYSNIGPEIDIAAPGGTPDAPVLSTYWDPQGGDGYEGLMGTSMAAPHVAGACALLLSGGVPANEVKEGLYDGATPAGSSSRPNREYGWGILNVPGAFTGKVKVIQPATGEYIETSMPTFVIEAKRIILDTLVVYVDFYDPEGTGEPDPGADEVPVISSANVDDYYDETTGLITFRWPVGGRDPFEPGKHKVHVRALSKSGVDQWATSSIVFFVQPWSQPAGLRMFSVPCAIESDDQEELTEEEIELRAQQLMANLLGDSGFALSRWVPSTSNYAIYDPGSGVFDPAASFDPPDAMVRTHGDPPEVRKPPAGVGYWLLLDSQRAMLTEKTTDRGYGFDIELTTGWNMVGNPFPFKVDWNNVLVTFQRRTLTLSDAVARQWISGTIFRYGANGYVSQTAPAGVLVPWEAVWVRVKGNTSSYGPFVLTVPPIPSQAAVPGSLSAVSAAAPASVAAECKMAGAPGGWRVRLSARAGDLADLYNAIGQRPGASNKYGPEDKESPPLALRCVELRFVHNDWGSNSGYYDEDIRAPLTTAFPRSATSQVWNFEVLCTEPFREVVLTWPDIANLPQGYGLILQDEATGELLRLTEYNRYTFTASPAGSPRRFSLYLVARTGTPLRISDARAQAVRGGAVVTYRISGGAMVKALIRDRNGTVVRTIGPVVQQAGQNRLSWDGGAGVWAGRGIYTVCLEASDGFGDSAYAKCVVFLR